MAMERWFRFIIVIPELTKIWSQPPPGGRQQTEKEKRHAARQKDFAIYRKIFRNPLLQNAISCHLT